MIKSTPLILVRLFVLLLSLIPASLAPASLAAASLAQASLAQPPHEAQTPRLTFEVASIRLAKPGTRVFLIRALPGGQQYTAQNIPVKLIISLMYRIPMRQISGGPEWLESDRYDIEAKADKSYSLDDLHIMFQNLLADRFNLKFHEEAREGNVYALTIDKSGLKMKPNQSEQDYNIPINFSGDGSVIGRRVSLPYLCWWLGQVLQNDQRPVIDQTSLSGNYDFSLAFAPVLPPDAPRDPPPAGVVERRPSSPRCPSS